MLMLDKLQTADVCTVVFDVSRMYGMDLVVIIHIFFWEDLMVRICASRVLHGGADVNHQDWSKKLIEK